MTDTPDPAAPSAPLPAAIKEPIPVGGPIAALVPQSIEQAFRLSQALAQSGDMVPEVFRGNAQKIMAAVLKGMEVGLAPMQSLASIAVINGRPVIWGDAIPALVQRAGHNLDCTIEGDGDDRVAVATLTRANGLKVTRSFSVEDAKVAGLWSKGGPWKAYPTRMLMMRARAFAARDGAADALMGMQIAEEAAEHGPDFARDVTPQQPPQAPRRGGAIYRDPLPIAQPEPAHDADGVVVEDGEELPLEGGSDV